MNITWLTQGGFLFQSGITRIVVDPYLSDCLERRKGLRRLVAPPLSIEQLKPDVVICTHNHLDHFDPETISQIATSYPDCLFAGPTTVQRHFREMGITTERIVLLAKDGSFKTGPFSLSSAPAFHGETDAIGLVIEADGMKVYLTGDTELTDELLDAAGNRVDLLLVCINGKWGNMNIDDAVRLAEVIQPGLAVPMHYGLFAENTVEPTGFIEQCRRRGINAACMNIGREEQLSNLLQEVES